MEEALTIAPIDPQSAFALLAGTERFDPRGIATPETLARMCEIAQPWAATACGGQAVYLVTQRGGQMCVEACAGSGIGAVRLLGAIELQARDMGLASIVFQTARPGLVRKATRAGYRIAGCLLKKELHEWT